MTKLINKQWKNAVGVLKPRKGVNNIVYNMPYGIIIIKTILHGTF